MKYKLLTLVFALLSLQVYSQNQSFCDAFFTPEQKQWLKQFQQKGDFSIPQRKSKIFIPIKAHIVGTSEGKSYYPAAYLLDAICNINEDFAFIGFHFYLKGDINYINNTSLFNFTYETYWQYTGSEEDPDALNIFFVNSTPGFCGVYMGGDDIVVIKNDCQRPGGNTLTHELGHFFSLPHTFSGWENGNTPPESMRELKNGSNCSFTGDGFCDTEPDYVATRWNCPLGPLLTDPNGETFRPDGTLYMSYADDACMNRFSNEQFAAMVTNRQSRGLEGTPLSYDTLGSVTQGSPSDNAFNTPTTGLLFNWNKVSGATHYELQIVNVSGFSVPLFDYVIKDTFFYAINLPAERELEWRVKAIKPGNTCSPYSEIRSFATGITTTGLTETTSENLAIYPNPVKRGEIVSLRGYDQEDCTIYDINGRVVFNESPLTFQTPGIYLIRFEKSGDAPVFKKLLVIE